MKPIRGGGATGMAMGRDRVESRQGFGNQLTFDQFMGKQKQSLKGKGRKSVGHGAGMEYLTPHKSRAGAPLVRPEFQKEYKSQMSGLQSQKEVAKRVKHYQANMNKSK